MEKESQIGTYKERTLHAALKIYFEPDTARHEIPFKGFIADILNENGIMEIQTKQFGRMRRKLDAFLPEMPVTIVYPVTRVKWLIWIDPETGAVTKKRRSPKVGTPYEVYYELYAISSYLRQPNLRIKIVMVDTEDYRTLDGWSKDRKRGSTRAERIPVGIGEEIDIQCLADYRKLIPEDLPESFTSADFARKAKLSRSSAQTALNILSQIGVVQRVGRDKVGYHYQMAETIGEA